MAAHRLEAKRHNARRNTGPRPASGNPRASMDALRRGPHDETPVPPDEGAVPWPKRAMTLPRPGRGAAGHDDDLEAVAAERLDLSMVVVSDGGATMMKPMGRRAVLRNRVVTFVDDALMALLAEAAREIDVPLAALVRGAILRGYMGEIEAYPLRRADWGGRRRNRVSTMIDDQLFEILTADARETGASMAALVRGAILGGWKEEVEAYRAERGAKD